ncbi:unnamed protein product [Gongylonema pulchrum]|uniref:VASP_tetra domain-containing protein n=1 Tax=Gongylonema pulchrum TaxID=637853 RepID=A0A183DPS5_9BILA|nr:unnamed protein product [Gongylonema pulchrum]
MPLYRSSAIKGPLHPAFAHFQAAVRQASTVNRSQSVSNAPTSTQGVTREQLRAATTLSVRREEKEKKEDETHWNGKSSSSSPSLESTPSDEIEKRVGEGRKEYDIKMYSPSPALSVVRRRSQAPRPSRRVTGPIQIDDLQTFEEVSDETIQKNSNDSPSSTATTTTLTQPSSDFSSTNIATTSYSFKDGSYTVSYAQAPLTNKTRSITQTNSVHIGGSTVTTSSAPFPVHNNRTTTNCSEANIDYKALYEKEKLETERLRRRLEELTLEVFRTY